MLCGLWRGASLLALTHITHCQKTTHLYLFQVYRYPSFFRCISKLIFYLEYQGLLGWGRVEWYLAHTANISLWFIYIHQSSRYFLGCGVQLKVNECSPYRDGYSHGVTGLPYRACQLTALVIFSAAVAFSYLSGLVGLMLFWWLLFLAWFSWWVDCAVAFFSLTTLRLNSKASMIVTAGISWTGILRTSSGRSVSFLSICSLCPCRKVLVSSWVN